MESDFSIGDVLTDAFQAFRARLGTHALFNVVYLVFVGTMGCMVTGCLSAIVLGAAAFFSGEADVESVAGPMSAGVLLSYVAGFLTVLASMTAHQGFTIELTVAQLRARTLELGKGVSAVGARLLGHIGLFLVRLGLDVLFFGLLVTALGFAVVSTLPDVHTRDVSHALHLLGEAAPAVTLAVVVGALGSFAWALGVRAFFGLAPAALQIEGLSPLAAMRRSAALLEGRRMQLVGLRLLWGATWLFALGVLMIPLFAIVFFAQSNGEPSPGVVLVVIPYYLFVYFAMYMLWSFDSALEAAFYARTAPPTPIPAEVAEAFT